MKKTFLTALIAATALVPVMASAQDGQGRRGYRGGDAAGQAQRQAARAERQAARASQPAAQQAPRADRQASRAERQAARPAQPAAQGGATFDREAFRAQRRTERATTPQAAAAPQQQRTIRSRQDIPGNPQQRAFRAERRDDRQDFRQERREDRRNLANGTVTQQQFRRDRRDDRQDYRADRRDDRQDFRRDTNRNDRGWNNGGGWNRGSANRWARDWRNDRRYDWQDWRRTNRNAYRLPRYYAPRGYHYGYQRFSIGFTLGSILYAQNYWISDPWAYRLPPAYGPYRWVRYYNDALLVDIETGEVVDVIHDIFW